LKGVDGRTSKAARSGISVRMSALRGVASVRCRTTALRTSQRRPWSAMRTALPRDWDSGLGPLTARAPAHRRTKRRCLCSRRSARPNESELAATTQERCHGRTESRQLGADAHALARALKMGQRGWSESVPNDLGLRGSIDPQGADAGARSASVAAWIRSASGANTPGCPMIEPAQREGDLTVRLA